jgi:chromate transporter
LFPSSLPATLAALRNGSQAASAVLTIVTASEVMWAFVGGGLLVWLVRVPPKFPRSTALSVSLLIPASMSIDWPQLATIFGFFAKAGTFVFGSGLTIVPFLYGGVVTEHHWLTEHQFVDAVAVAMIMPGPVVITVGFIGFLVAGLPGATAAAIGTFLPCYLFTVLPAPYFKKHGKRPATVAFVDGATAAAVGTITGSVVVLGRRSIVELPTLALALVAALVLSRFKKFPEPVLILIAAGSASSFIP